MAKLTPPSTLSGPCFRSGDLNLWSLANPRERFWAARTRQLQRAHVSIYDRLWSCLPYLRPLCTITGDSLADFGSGGNGKGGGVDAEGGRVHDLLGTVSQTALR